MKQETIELLQAVTVKNDKGQSNISYEKIKDIKGRYYPIKASIEFTPIGLNDKAKYILITKSKEAKPEHFIKINNVIYAVDMFINYTAHKEIYLKEL